MHPVLLRFALLLLAIGLLPVGAFAQRGKPSPSPAKTSTTPSPTAAPTPTPQPQYVLPEPVATVNGQAVHRDELERLTETYLNANNRSLKTLPIADQKRVYRQMLDSIVIDRLITAQDANETLPASSVDTRLEELRRQYPDAATFDADLKRSGQTLDQVRTTIRNELLREYWINRQIADQTVVTAAEAEKYYQDGPPTKFDEPERVAASHILIKARRDAPPEEALTAENRANDAAEHLKKGENFEDVALAFSDDPTVKRNKGNLGLFTREAVLPEFAAAAFALKPGEISAPVRTQFGYHIIKVTDRKPAHTDTLDEACPRIMAYLQEQKRQQATVRLVEKLRADAKIEIPEDLRSDAAAASLTP